MSVIGNPIMVGGGGESHLPSGFQKVEYLESTGTQYLNLGYVPNNSESYIVDCLPRFSYNTIHRSGEYVLGTNDGNGWALSFGKDNNKLRLTFRAVGINYSQLVNENQKLHIVCSKDGLSVNGQNYTDTLVAGYEIGNKNLEVFSAGILAGPNPEHTQSHLRIYSLEIYNGSELTRSLIPCYRINNSAAGMFDIVQGNFYTNAGTGTFVVGPDAT